jgi:hypothetical protein
VIRILAACALLAAQEKPHVLRVVDDATGRGVPLVELRTTNGIAHQTDNAGVVAFDEPGLLGSRVFFFVESHGHEFPADGFGMRGTAVETKPGGETTLRIRRVNVAERLGRITGQGLFHHSLRAGLPVPHGKGAENAGVMGQDSAGAVVHGGRVRWFWGDTSLARYAMGHFGTATATSDPAADPAKGIELSYAVDARGHSRPTFDLGVPGAVWVHCPFALRDPEGRERILAEYERVKDVASPKLEQGIAVFDDAAERFTPLRKLPLDEERRPFGQAFVDGEHLYFALPYPFLRVRAAWEDVLDPSRYEAFTCLEAGAHDAGSPRVERDAAGKPVYAWKKGALPVDAFRQQELVRKGALKDGEGWVDTVDATSGKAVQLHRGSVRWNAHRKRFVMIATRMGGEESMLGDVYYAEASRPEGPWPKAAKVVGHKRYSFYNPVHHAFLDREGGRVIHFEGTYTVSFSDAPAPTPRYDYNQILYRLDLDDPRLAPARR